MGADSPSWYGRVIGIGGRCGREVLLAVALELTDCVSSAAVLGLLPFDDVSQSWTNGDLC